MYNSIVFILKLSSVTVGFLVKKMDLAFPKELATEILSDSDHSTKVAPTTLKLIVSIKRREDLAKPYRYAVLLKQLYERRRASALRCGIFYYKEVYRKICLTDSIRLLLRARRYSLRAA